MKTFLYGLMLTVIVAPLKSQNLYINDANPVGRNIGFYLESGEVSWRTSFNLSQAGSNLFSDLGTVQLGGRAVWSSGVNRNQNFEATLTPVNGSPGLYEAILKSDDGARSVIFKKSPASDAKWDQLTITVSYSVKGVKYTLPEVILLSPGSQESTKLDLVNRGIVLDNSSVMISVNVIGAQSVKVSRAEITSDNGSVTKTFGNEYTGLGPFKIKLDLLNAQPIVYKVKIFAETTTGTQLLPAEKDISFFNQIKITSVDANTGVGNGYRFNMRDKQKTSFQITTNGVGDLIVSPAPKDCEVNLVHQGSGVYQLSVETAKLRFDNEERLDFMANGAKLPGNWILLFCPPLEPTISTSQGNKGGVDFLVSFPAWITSDVNVQIPKRNSVFTIPNRSAVIQDTTKIFKLSLSKNDFSQINSSLDSVFNGKVNIFLANKKLLSQEFKFLNFDFYLKKIGEAQKKEKKNERKEEIKKVLNSLFASTGSNPDSTLIKDIVSNLSSGKEEDKKNGMNQVIGFATKFAPLLIALL